MNTLNEGIIYGLGIGFITGFCVRRTMERIRKAKGESNKDWEFNILTSFNRRAETLGMNLAFGFDQKLYLMDGGKVVASTLTYDDMNETLLALEGK